MSRCALQTGTDYGPFLANEASPIHTTTLVDCCTRKLVADWRYLRENVSAGQRPAPSHRLQRALCSRRTRSCSFTVLHRRAAPPQAGEPLGQFLDYCTYGHMIDNVVLIVTGTLHERDVQVRSAGCTRSTGRRRPRCRPLAQQPVSE